MEPATAILLASAASSAAGMYNNQRNIQYAGKVNQESVELANTAHQREVRDLQAAGLNPVLSAQSSGAPVPQLSTPSLDPIDGGIGHSATSLARALSGEMKADAALRRSQMGVNDSQAFNLQQDGILKAAQAELVHSGLDVFNNLPKSFDQFGDWAGRKWQEWKDEHSKRYPTRHWYFAPGFDADGYPLENPNLRK